MERAERGASEGVRCASEREVDLEYARVLGDPGAWQLTTSGSSLQRRRRRSSQSRTHLEGTPRWRRLRLAGVAERRRRAQGLVQAVARLGVLAAALAANDAGAEVEDFHV